MEPSSMLYILKKCMRRVYDGEKLNRATQLWIIEELEARVRREASKGKLVPFKRRDEHGSV